MNKKESRRKWMLHLLELYGSKNVNNTYFQFWKQDNHPIELYNPKWMRKKINYIHQNPVKAGFVRFAEDYIYSSAGDYVGRGGILDVELIVF